MFEATVAAPVATAIVTRNPSAIGAPPGALADGQGGLAGPRALAFAPPVAAGLSAGATLFLQNPTIAQAPTQADGKGPDAGRSRNPAFAPAEDASDARRAVRNGEEEAGAENGPGDEDSSDPQQRTGPDGLTPEERQVVQELRQRDTEVRRHEQAHAAVGGPYAGAPHYTYTTGPDNRRYATGREVSIDVSPVPGNPEATIRKMQVVRRAALAPAQPSPQDQRVAAQAQQNITAARQEKIQQDREEQAERAEAREEQAAQRQGETAGEANSALAVRPGDAADRFAAASASDALLRADRLGRADVLGRSTRDDAIDPGATLRLFT